MCSKFGIPYPNDNPCPLLAEGGVVDDAPFSFCYADDKSYIHDVVFLITAHNEYTGGQLQDSTEGLSLKFNASTDTYKVWDRKSMK